MLCVHCTVHKEVYGRSLRKHWLVGCPSARTITTKITPTSAILDPACVLGTESLSRVALGIPQTTVSGTGISQTGPESYSMSSIWVRSKMAGTHGQIKLAIIEHGDAVSCCAHAWGVPGAGLRE